LTPELIRALQTAREWGVTQTEAIAAEQAERLGCSVSLCRRYLTEIMDYDLGDQELAGLEEFANRCRRHQLLLRDRPIEMALYRA
jgi:predicted solute-binding protein